MNSYRGAVFLTLLVGSFACGGSEFSAPGDDGGTSGQGGNGSTASTSVSSSSATSSTVTSFDTVGVTTTNGSGGSSTTGNAGGSGGSGAGGDGGRSGGGPTGGSGGQLADAHSDAFVPCDTAMPTPVTFQMTGGGVDYCINLCSNTWVSILPEGGGTPLAIAQNCTTSCSQCQPIVCGAGACIAPRHIKPEGETLTWDGTLWEQSKCGAQMVSCVNQVCAPHGKYIARMCASRSTSDAGSYCMSASTQTCVDVPFEYPTNQTVEGVLK